MFNDPAYRFTVVYKDGREMSQTDDKGVVVRDHAHVEDWDNVEIYALVNRPGDHVLTVNFTTGDFSIDSHIFKIMDKEMDMYFGFDNKEVTYKPIYGRRIFNGEAGRRTFFYLGWETKIRNKKARCILYVSEDGTTYLEKNF